MLLPGARRCIGDGQVGRYPFPGGRRQHPAPTQQEVGRFIAAGWVLVRADALVPREIDHLLPPSSRMLARTLRLFSGPEARRGRPGERLARAFERLGPVSIKFGQILSTRADIFGRAFADDMAKLKDQLPPFPTEVARAEVEASLDRPLAAIFASFGEPIAQLTETLQVLYHSSLEPNRLCDLQPQRVGA